MTEVTYHCFENPHILARLKVMMEEYKTLLPKWLNTMSIVSSNSDGDTKVLRAHYGQHEYMHARISVFPQWFDQAEKQQRIGLIHELVHIQHAALMDFTESHWIAPLEERNPELYGVIHEEYRVKLERFTESTAIAIYESMEAAKVFKTPEGITVHESEFTRDPPSSGKCFGCREYVDALFHGFGPDLWLCQSCMDARHKDFGGSERPTDQAAQKLQNAQGTTGDGKPYTGVSAIAPKGTLLNP